MFKVGLNTQHLIDGFAQGLERKTRRESRQRLILRERRQGY
jgi:hypothetical protein